MRGAINLRFYLNSLQPVLTLRQGKPSTPVMPANFEANVFQIASPAIVPPTQDQALQELAAAPAASDTVTRIIIAGDSCDGLLQHYHRLNRSRFLQSTC